MSTKLYPRREEIRPDGLPHFFCPGCGAAQVLNYFLRACHELDMKPQDMTCIGGVGCAARIPIYLDTDVLHGIHGRTLPWATGIKMIRPEMPVVVFAGDGDALSIGGNHFIHAARRNVDVTVIVVNNLNFAMTGGQVAPTTPMAAHTMTTPYGSSEPPFDLCKMAEQSGATYVSRWTTAHGLQAIRSIKTALGHRGFSVVEIISQCPTHYGRYALGTGNPVKSVEWIKQNSIPRKRAEQMDPKEAEQGFVIGEFVNVERPIFRGSTVYGSGDTDETS
ncbi:MAG: thiamine pyrophosphate-dependent enzyme [Clostridia bacterium]